MPRIYTSDQNQDSQTVLFGFHGLIYVLVLWFAWANGLQGVAVLTSMWTMILAYHNYSRWPILDGLQRRTYDRLRNRYGKDWEIGITAQEFEAERQYTLTEAKVRSIAPATIQVVLMLLLLWLALILTQRLILPAGLITSFWTGLGITFVSLNILMQSRLRNANRYQPTLKKQDKSQAPSVSLNRLQSDLHPRAGMTFAVGDDGELIEVPLKNK